jgi:LysM repeat protein
MRKIIGMPLQHCIHPSVRALIVTAFALSALSALTLPSALAANTAEPKPVPQLAASAPERYTVKSGDTLWGISSKFLKDPYRWGEVFKHNKPPIKNPHLIYPGQVLVLERGGNAAGGIPTIKLEPREYVEPIAKPVWTVSPDAVASFLTKPLVMEPGAIEKAARIVGLQDNQVIIGAGHRLYATNVGKAQRDWHVFKLGDVLKDPETGENLGQEVLFLGEARQLTEGTQPTEGPLGRQTKDGLPAEFMLRSSNQEVGIGNYLLPAPPAQIIDYAPKAPSKAIKGRILSLAGGVGIAGPNSVVSINRGKADGIELGHVLATDRAGDVITDRANGATDFQLPDRRNGLIFIFRVFDRVAYGLVMESERPVYMGDAIRTP